MELKFSLQIFLKKSSNFKKFRPMEAEFVPCGRAGR